MAMRHTASPAAGRGGGGVQAAAWGSAAAPLGLPGSRGAAHAGSAPALEITPHPLLPSSRECLRRSWPAPPAPAAPAAGGSLRGGQAGEAGRAAVHRYSGRQVPHACLASPLHPRACPPLPTYDRVSDHVGLDVARVERGQADAGLVGVLLRRPLLRQRAEGALQQGGDGEAVERARVRQQGSTRLLHAASSPRPPRASAAKESQRSQLASKRAAAPWRRCRRWSRAPAPPS